MPPLDAVVAAMALPLAGYLIVAIWCVWRAAGKEKAVRHEYRPSVTVLKPLCGDEPHLYECLRSFCLQDYAGLQIVCGVSAPDDPAAETVRRLVAEFPRSDIALVVDGTSHGANRKVSNLLNMMRASKHEVIVVSDSDVRLAPRDFVAGVVEALADPGVGAVTCPYRGLPDQGLSNALGALLIDEGFFVQTLIAARLGPIDFALGAVTAFRRSVLDAIGGFAAVADHLADDFMLGQLVARRGYRVVLSDRVAATVLSDTVPSLLRRELRWARTIRATQPVDHLASIVTHGAPVMAILALADPDAVGAALLATILSLRLVLHGIVERRLSGLWSRRLWLVPLRDLVGFAIWVASFAGRDVVWRGRVFTIAANGTLHLAEAARAA